MTPITSSTQLAALIRSQVASLRKPGSAPAQKKGAQKKNQSEQDIASLVAHRVSIIDAEDPQRRRKAFKIFLESVLIAELGENLSNDPAFYQMVESIQQQMEGDVQLAASMNAASDMLLAAKPNS